MAEGIDLRVIAKLLTEAFGNHALVEDPDHPLLLRAPDLLTAINGNLTAIFSPQVLEERNPAHLATRLIASRLALPDHTRTVLLISEKNESRFGSLFSEFSLVTTLKDRSISTFLAEKTESRTAPSIEPALRKFIIKQMDRTFSATESGFRTSRIAKRKGSFAERSYALDQRRVVQTIGDRGLNYTPMNRALVGGEMSSILNGETKHNLRRQILSTASGCILERYSSENGYIKLIKNEPHMAIAYNIDEIFGLRDKVTTASAFSSVFLVPDDSIDVIVAANSRWRKFEVT